MNKYPGILFFFTLVTALISFSKVSFAQPCSALTATFSVSESRCAATGSMEITASGGSGFYQYKLAGPVNVSYTTSNLITGLSRGYYQVTVMDTKTNCTFTRDSVLVPGNYLAPNFNMTATGVTCINGNDGTISLNNQVFGRAPFSYKIIAPSASKVNTISATGNFSGLISGNYLIQLSDSCGALQTRSIDVLNYNWTITAANVTKNCDSVTIDFKLRDSYNNVLPNAVFNGFTYGVSLAPGDTSWYNSSTISVALGNKHSINLFVKDNCGNMRSTFWIDNAIPRVSNTVSINNYACSTFSAAITGQRNLTSPTYCIYNSSNALIACNTTGNFDLLSYGSYCIKIVNSCYDTTITRCFTVNKPIPSVAANVAVVTTCTSVTASVTGQSNIYNASYCVYDSVNTLIGCNSTGVFTNLPDGNFCVKITNNIACYDTVITRCFTVKRPIPSVNSVVRISNLTCATFTATIQGATNLNNPQFCIFNAANVSIACNTTGVFNNLPYGAYCINIVNGPGCYDTTIIRCFNVARPLPSVNSTVAISNRNCTTFTAAITGQNNINNAQYCLYNSLNALVACNTTGVFANIPYDSYCINVANDVACYDTTIKRCFTVSAIPVDISLSSSRSCTVIGTSDIRVTFNSGTAPFLVSLFSPSGVLLSSASTSSASYTLSSVAAITAPLKYKIIVTDQCGNNDSLSITPNASRLNRVISTSQKCPSALWSGGSADVLVDLTDNNILGGITPSVIRMNGAVVSIAATSIAGAKYTFLDLAPATYVFDTYIRSCNKHLYDTLTVTNYIYPDLSSSKIYQCDSGNINVTVNAANGKQPYKYEIFGSLPSLPSIVTSPQPSPVFTISNGNHYSLIRLRLVDACGNASLYDASVHPLADVRIIPTTTECFNENFTLTVDSIPNATYAWYKKGLSNDSVQIGNDAYYSFTNLLQNDTGRYVAKVVVSNGCLTKYASYIVTGSCKTVLPAGVALTGQKQQDRNILSWNGSTLNVKEYNVQRSSQTGSGYQTINSITNNSIAYNYSFTDKSPFAGNNFYRINIKTQDNRNQYSNTLWLQNTRFAISFYPNPVHDILYISLSNISPKNYNIEMVSMAGQKIFFKTYYNLQNAVIKYPRPSGMQPGIYSVTLTDLQTNERQTYKVDFK